MSIINILDFKDNLELGNVHINTSKEQKIRSLRGVVTHHKKFVANLSSRDIRNYVKTVSIGF